MNEFFKYFNEVDPEFSKRWIAIYGYGWCQDQTFSEPQKPEHDKIEQTIHHHGAINQAATTAFDSGDPNIAI